MMQKQLRVLMLEDNSADAELVYEELKSGGLDVVPKWVESRSEFLDALEHFQPDVILSDHSLPSFDGIAALTLAREKSPQIPFIFVAGTLGEETAIELLKCGATDYILKDRLTRLVPAIVRALKESTELKERKRIEDALKESEERYAIAVRGANDGLWDWDLRTNRCYFSSRWKQMLGFEDHEISSTPDQWMVRIHPEDLEPLRTHLSEHVDGLSPHFECEHRMLHRNGTYRWMLARGLALRDENGKAYRIAGSQTDITERKRTEEKLVQQALYDSLTNLPNRTLFSDRLSHAVKRAQRAGNYMFAVLFLDLDRFKNINDSLGHLVGDQLLIAIARRLETCIRPGDTVARVGGDEFAIWLENIQGISAGTKTAERIHQRLQGSIHIQDYEVFTNASIGIVLSQRSYTSPEDLLRDADAALYRAKALGRARYEVFDAEVRERAVAILKLETDLRRAIERHEFELHYQPIVHLATGRIAGFESLIRWKHPVQGMTWPNSFVPTLEETGLIIPIGWRVLEESCRQLKEWQDKFPQNPGLSVSVNFSAKQFSQPHFMDYMKLILEKTSLDPQALNVEITETVILENSETVKRKLFALKDLNIHIYIDDFGTGYSSLSYLHRFPLDTLKIDQSFVSSMDASAHDLEIVRAIVSLAQNLQKHTVAEGIENHTQAQLLAEMNCGYGQGFLFSKPLAANDMTQLMKEHFASPR